MNYTDDNRGAIQFRERRKQIIDFSGLRVGNITPTDCVLFLWTTHKFIWDAKELLDHWGFDYRCMLVWNKQKLGTGNLIRMQCEFCLIGLKGKPTFKDVHNIRDLIEEPRREHSRKPEAFYQLVEELCAGRKLDYFSRQQREGWSTYGNDTDKFGLA